MKRIRLTSCVVVCLCMGPAAVAAQTQPSADENMALGKPYTFSLPPSYRLCTDAGDVTDLTDGVSKGRLWTNKGLVGWKNKKRRLIRVTVDLGKVEPISGVAFTSAAGGSGVAWPASIAVLVSDDGKTFRLAGELMRLAEGPLPPAYEGGQSHTFRTRRLQTRGRFVQFAMASAGKYVFCEEIDVYRGGADLLKPPPAGRTVTETELMDPLRLTRLGCYRRLRRDLESVVGFVRASSLDAPTKEGLLADLAGAKEELERQDFPKDLASFRAIVPFNGLHRRIFRARARALAADEAGPVRFWHSHPYEMLSLFAQPQGQLAPLRVEMMPGERRAEVINVTNVSQAPRLLQLRIESLPDRINPPYVRPFQVEYVDTREGQVVASALVPIPRRGNTFITDIPAGMTRQIWLAFEPKNLPPGKHRGWIYLASGAVRRPVGLELSIAPVRFPARPDCSMGLWDYVANTAYGITSASQTAAVADMMDHFVDTVWLSRTRNMPIPRAADVDKEGNITGKIDFAKWDAFVKLFPKARYYFAFLGLRPGRTFAGKTPGTKACDRAVSQWAAAWAKHNRRLGLKPRQAGVLIMDEPKNAAGFKLTWQVAKALKAGSDEILILMDPVVAPPTVRYGPEAAALCDILCPLRAHYTGRDKPHQAYYQKLRAAGKTLWFYMCSGPTRQFNPGYYRLQPWHCLAVGATGSNFWSYGDDGGANSWNEYPSVGRTSYTPVYLAPDSVTTTKHWEAAREGIQDFQYLKMLQSRETALANSACLPGSRLQEARKAAETRAKSVIDTVHKHFGVHYAARSTKNPSIIADVERHAVLLLLTALYSAEAGK